MLRAVSIAQANRLGDRLRKSSTPSEADLKMLQVVLADHAAPMARVQAGLTVLGLPSTARFKTSGTIIDKLKRDATRLSKMQDLAGARVVRDMGLLEQDEIVAKILGAFPNSKPIDLRDKGRSGYRAVHVVVPIDECTVEVQVRTQMQDLWANLIESFEGEMGRDVRYGGKPDFPRRRVSGIRQSGSHLRPTQTQTIKGMMELSNLVKSLEDDRVALGKTRNRELQKEIASTEKEVKSLFKRILKARRKGIA